MAFNYLNKDGLQYFWNKIKAKIGTATLNTTAQDLSGAVNELKTDLTTNFDNTRFYNFAVGSNSTLTITINNNSRLILFTSNNMTNSNGGNIIYADGSGTIGIVNFAAASYVAITSNTANKCNIANNSNRELRCCVICMQGGISI